MRFAPLVGVLQERVESSTDKRLPSENAATRVRSRVSDVELVSDIAKGAPLSSEMEVGRAYLMMCKV